MDAIICNAGKGTRLGPLGVYTRKCLFRDAHADKSILWYQLDALHELGVQRCVVVIPAEDTQILAEVARLHDRHPGMEIQCVPVCTGNVLESIAAGLEAVHSDRVVRLDGDVCILNRRDLSALASVRGNALCCYPAGETPMNSATPVVVEGEIRFWTPELDAPPVWSCLDLWHTRDLKRVTGDPAGGDSPFMFQRINQLRKALPPLQVEVVSIPPVYEIDTPEDVALLHQRWDEHAAALEQESLEYWSSLNTYPPFTVDKERMWAIDTELVLEQVRPGDRVLELGAGPGMLIAPVLERCALAEYMVVEPNLHWAEAMQKKFTADTRVQVFAGDVSVYAAVTKADLAFGFGWAPYIIQDSALHRILLGLPAKRLMIKAPEPPQERFSRLRVDHYSKELGTRYISLYRSASETCRLLRHAGWIVRELRREIYPAHLESAYGSRTFLVSAERPGAIVS